MFFQLVHNTIFKHGELPGVGDMLAVTPLNTLSLYWNKDDGDFPTSDYRNFSAIIGKTNKKIEAYNTESGVAASPNFFKRAGERGLKMDTGSIDGMHGSGRKGR